MLDRIDLNERQNVLLAGWGADAYTGLIAARWPQVRLTSVNPALGEPLPRSRFDAVIISGLLGSATREDCEEVVSSAAGQLNPGGVLMVQDDLLSVGASVAPEVALARLARRVTNGNSAEWSVERVSALLEKAGLRASSNPLAGAGMLITSECVNSSSRESLAATEAAAAR